MTKKNSQWAQIGKRKLELSNLEKVIFPEDNIVKAEVIQYYLTIAPTILRHIKGRALTLIRFPDGIHGESFFQKNRPEWSPDWIEYETLGSSEKDYIVATEQALLVWLANLACLELHQLHSRRPNFDKPDYMVFDLDPPEGYSFQKVVSLGVELKDFLERYGYTPFVKTTGGKGIHICCPLETKYDFNEVFEAAQSLAQPFVDAHSTETTLHIKKDARKGRVLVDIYRIRSGQTIVSPYSLRGRIGAPVSMPLPWEELTSVTDPKSFNIQNAVAHVVEHGDAWESIDAFSARLHTKRSAQVSVPKRLPKNRKHKQPEQLETYSKKRDFSVTPEPAAQLGAGESNNFVVHRHHASHLHYDLRLEQDGVLKSWAVPKGLPPRPGVKRLAVQTEDHPMQYLTFDGKIPKGQYGAGEMWIYALGKYQITKEKKDGFYFRLNSKEMSGEYRMHRTKEKEYLLERVDEPQVDFLNRFTEPMLSESAATVPTGDYVYEVKWDGIRALILFEEGNIRIFTRNKNEITSQFPELNIGDKAFRATNAVYDAEIVCLDESGKPVFKKVINRMMSSGETNISKLSKTNPAYCYIFDCLYMDGRSLLNEPLMKRKELMRDSIRNETPYRFSEHVDDGESLLEAARAHELEGIMAKQRSSRYLPGKRTDCWVKIKIRQTAEVLVIGFTKGNGDRSTTFGALQIAEREGDVLQYRGKVGTGFDSATMKEIMKLLSKVEVAPKAKAEGKVVDGKITTWLEPVLFIEVSYARLTPDQNFREPVFLRIRPDISELPG